jgi:hypothetical protein
MSYAQELSAKVIDENNEPFINATVYFDGTTIGVITNLDGVFTIEKPYNLTDPALVITSLGYETIYITDIDHLQDTYQLKPKSVTLDAVNIYDSPFSREEMLEVFKTYFLGSGKEARQCEILNLKDVSVYFVKDENTLYARAANPINVQNDYLGYQVSFDLKIFKVKYSTTSLDDEFFLESFYGGYPFFKDTNPRRQRIRQKTYFSSLNFFFKSLVEDKLDLTNFTVGYDGVLMNPEKVLDVTPLSNNIYKVSLKNPEVDIETGAFKPTKIILTHKYDISNLLFKAAAIRVDQYGNNLDFDKIRLLGELSEYRLAKMLPTNFVPKT